MNYDKILIKLFFDENKKLNKNYKKVCCTKNTKYSNILQYIKERYNDSSCYRETIYRILFGIENRPVCLTCGKEVSFNVNRKQNKIFSEHCSVSCEMKDKNVMQKHNETCKKKYGSVNNIKKYKETCLERYGVDNGAKADITKEKTRKTCLEKFGEVSSLLNDTIKEKTRKTNLERYGSEFAQSNNKVKQKIAKSNKETCLTKYGVENVMQISEISELVKQTCLERYGVSNPAQFNEIREKIKETMMREYGVEYPMRSSKLYAKALETKRKNGTFNTSKFENIILEKLKQKFPDVKTQYKDSKRYPFNCDFYIPNLDIFIEYQGTWTHGFHAFNKHDSNDLETVEYWKSKNTPYYDAAIKNWTIADVLKRETAKKNNLNYLEFFTLSEFEEWFEAQ